MRGFVPFGPDHLAVLGCLALVAGALIVGRRWLRGRDDCWVRRGIAALLAGNELIGFGIALRHGVIGVPLQLCDLALILTVWALLTLRPFVSQVAYCWALAGSLQAILTPDLVHGFPDYWWVQFFLSHCGVVLSVIYLAVSGRVVLTHRTVWKIWALTNVYAAGVGCVNWALGTNYGYLAHKPRQPSVLDFFGPWPYYILGMEGLALVFLYVCYAPFALGRRLARGD